MALVSADEWQKLADRAHSIVNEMTALQAILVDWRKMEVQCWSGIVGQVEEGSLRTAVLSAWPIINYYKGASGDEQKLIMMLVDWIHNSSLGDFEARLSVGKLLAHIASLPSRPEPYSDGLATKIHSVLAHFNVLSPAVGDAFGKIKKCAEQELKDFVLIVKYNDINLWSVRQSTQKAHTQLHRILKKFKVCGLLFGGLGLGYECESFSGWKQ